MVFKYTSLGNAAIFQAAFWMAFAKLSPRQQFRNPVMFAVYISTLLMTGICIQHFLLGTQLWFILALTGWLWITIFFSNFAEAIAEGRGKAQAQSLRESRRVLQAKKLAKPQPDSKITLIPFEQLRLDDIVFVQTGDFIPSDGEVIDGIASVNESAVTGESAPVIRESGGDRSSVTGGTQVLSDWLIIRVTSNPGESFIDKMIALVEGAQRQKTPNELALTILLAVLTIIFLLVCSTLVCFSLYTVDALEIPEYTVVSIPRLVALFVCLAPTTISALLSAIGIAGMDRMLQANVIALSGHAVEAAGDVDILILDKTGTVTLGNRHAIEFIPIEGVDIETLADAAQLASLADETPEGRSIVILAKQKYGLREREITKLGITFIPFSAHSKMSGATLADRQIRKGAMSAIELYVTQLGGVFPESAKIIGENIARTGGTPLVVAQGKSVLGIIYLKDIIKGGIQQRFAKLRGMGIKTIMVTGDNELTAAAIAAESGVDDFLAQANPEDKLNLIRQLQAQGHLVAMMGDGTNDAPALAQSDVAVAMNTGTQAAKEAGNLIDLDSNPTKLIEIVALGKQLLMTRGAITTFSISNDVAKYFAVLPAVFATTYPALNVLNIMQLNTPQSAILSTIIFNALIIVALIPLALKGVPYHAWSAARLLRNNVLYYGLGGLIVPFVGIKIIDVLLGYVIPI